MANRKHTTAETVTTENFGDLLIESMQEAVDIHEGRRDPAVVRSYPLTARKARVAAAPRMTGPEIRRLRQSLRLSQPVFSAALNVSAATDRAWEQSKRVPEGPSLRLLQIAQRHPAVILEYVAERIAAEQSRQDRRRRQKRGK